MSDIMTCMPFEQLLDWIRTEHDTKGTVFGVHRPYVAAEGRNLSIFGRNLETAYGPAPDPTVSWPRILRRPIMRAAGSLN